MCQKVDNLYPSWNTVIEKIKVAELVIGTNRKPAEIANIVQFMDGCLDMCHLNGDMPSVWAYLGDTLIFYKQVYVAKPYFVPIAMN